MNKTYLRRNPFKNSLVYLKQMGTAVKTSDSKEKKRFSIYLYTHQFDYSRSFSLK